VIYALPYATSCTVNRELREGRLRLASRGAARTRSIQASRQSATPEAEHGALVSVGKERGRYFCGVTPEQARQAIRRPRGRFLWGAVYDGLLFPGGSSGAMLELLPQRPHGLPQRRSAGTTTIGEGPGPRPEPWANVERETGGLGGPGAGARRGAAYDASRRRVDRGLPSKPRPPDPSAARTRPTPSRTQTPARPTAGC
jgi:hypothetical protein